MAGEVSNYTIKVLKPFEILTWRMLSHRILVITFKTPVISSKSSRSNSANYSLFTLAPASNYRKLLTFLFVKAKVFEEISSFQMSSTQQSPLFQ